MVVGGLFRKVIWQRWVERRRTTLKGFAFRASTVQATIMKTIILSVGAVAIGLLASRTEAQDAVLAEGGGEIIQPAMVYQAPVVYQVPVIYQAPVVYQAPVIYQAPVVYAAAPMPTVIYVGGPGSCDQNYYGYPGCSSPTVIYFGRGQSYQQGYHFRHGR